MWYGENNGKKSVNLPDFDEYSRSLTEKESEKSTTDYLINDSETNIDNREQIEQIKHNISRAVINRLPRYYRYLRELLTRGQTRISSGELADLMNVTASQIRQDLNCFGGFGQQGYGYNVNFLYTRISEILGVGAGFCAIIIGAGDLGRALVHLSMFEKRGVDIVGMFDTGEGMVGREVAGVKIYSLDMLETFISENKVDIAVLTPPKDKVKSIADRLVACNVKGLWNFMGVELNYDKNTVVVENVHLGDSLMILNYEISSAGQKKFEEEV